MPVDITSVTVGFENGIKREEYGPTRKASVSLTAAVDKGEDGVVALNYLGTLARAKVGEMLGLELPVAAAELIHAPAPGEPEASKPRTRRTKAQIEADAAAALAAGSTGAASTTGDQTASGQQAAEDWGEPEVIPPTSSASPASTADEWSEPAAPISDADMAMHCSKHAQRLGGGDKVKAAIVAFKPEGWAQPKFGVTDIVSEKRPLFVAALEALTP